MAQGFLTADSNKAQQFFDLATEQFDEALQQDQSNDVYRKAVEMTKKAPELHKELQRQLAAQGEVRVFIVHCLLCNVTHIADAP